MDPPRVILDAAAHRRRGEKGRAADSRRHCRGIAAPRASARRLDGIHPRRRRQARAADGRGARLRVGSNAPNKKDSRSEWDYESGEDGAVKQFRVSGCEFRGATQEIAQRFQVIPAQAGIQSFNAWTRAFAGVTEKGNCETPLNLPFVRGDFREPPGLSEFPSLRRRG